MLEGHAVAHKFGRAAVDALHLAQREVFLAFLGRAYGALHYIAGLETVVLDLRLRHIDVVGRGQVVVVARAQEAIAVGHDLEQAAALEYVVEVVVVLAVGAILHNGLWLLRLVFVFLFLLARLRLRLLGLWLLYHNGSLGSLLGGTRLA